MSETTQYPAAVEAEKVGTYPGTVYAGGGYVWDEVLEYRVWCHPERGAPDLEDGSDYFYSFGTYLEASDYAANNPGSEEPLALIRQDEYIDESEPGEDRHVKEERVTEWPVGFLTRPRRTSSTIPDFLAADAPANRLDILRGLAK